MITRRYLIVFLILMSACTLAPPSSKTAVSTPSATSIPNEISATHTVTPTFGQSTTTSQVGKCVLAPFIAPTMPAKIPAVTKLDETTGLHMTGHPQVIDMATYRLVVNGKVDHPLSLSLDDLRCMPKVTVNSDLDCPGVFSDSGTWTGVSIRNVLEQAGVQESAKKVVFKSADDYKNAVDLEFALNKKYFLAYEMDGKPLPILHGFPLRAVFPDQPGARWVKWLVEITVE